MDLGSRGDLSFEHIIEVPQWEIARRGQISEFQLALPPNTV
jgi:hypothetical protein